MSKTCPVCHLFNPPETLRCDCGYDFATATRKDSYLAAHVVQKAGGLQSFLQQQSRHNIQQGAAFIGVGAAMTGAIYYWTESHPPLLIWAAIFWGSVKLARGANQRRLAGRAGNSPSLSNLANSSDMAISQDSQKPAPEPRTPPENWTVSGINFDTQGWRLGPTSASSMKWSDSEGSEITLKKVSRTEDPTEGGLDELRDVHRRQAEQAGGGIVSVEVRSSSRIPALEIVTKHQRGTGYDYEGTLIVVGGAHTYSVSVKANEGKLTGVRDALVSAQMFALGALVIPAAAQPNRPTRIPGWSYDPYDPDLDTHAINSVSDDERLDVIFPSHPVSRVRRHLQQVSGSLELADSQHATIEGPRDPQRPLRRLLPDEVVRALLGKIRC